MTPLEKLGLEVAAFTLLGSRAQASTLCALIDANGRELNAEQLAASRPWKQHCEERPELVLKVRICLLRGSLDDLGLEGVIKTSWGAAMYSLPEPGRTKVIERLIEVAK